MNDIADEAKDPGDALVDLVTPPLQEVGLPAVLDLLVELPQRAPHRHERVADLVRDQARVAGRDGGGALLADERGGGGVLAEDGGGLVLEEGTGEEEEGGVLAGGDLFEEGAAFRE